MSTSPSASTSASAATLVQGQDERSPLLRKPTVNFKDPETSAPLLEVDYTYGSNEDDDEIHVGEGDKGREVEVYKPGKSNFTQTLLNILGDIIGTGLLATPIAIAHAGWVLGPIMLCVIGAVTLWTLKMLLRIIEKDRRLRNFTEVIGFGLGARGEAVVTALFLIEIGVWVVALVVLYSDSLQAVFPVFSSDQWKVVGLAVIIPTGFFPLRYLSFSSAIGIISTWALVAILIFSGITTPHSPGALRDPAPTDVWPSHGWTKLALVPGLMISGFGGHGLIPNVIRDMKNPKQADLACDVAYGIAMVVYLLIAVCGYLMYGTDVSDEISKDLANTAGVSPFINKLAVLMVAITPLTKLPLGLRPLGDLLFSYLGLHPTVLIPQTAPTPRYTTTQNSPAATPPLSPHSHGATLPENGEDDAAALLAFDAEAKHTRKERTKKVLRPIIRVALSVFSVVGALAMPSFEKLLSFLGSGFAILTMIIIPIWAKASVFGWKTHEIVVCVLSALVAIAGVVCSFWSYGDI